MGRGKQCSHDAFVDRSDTIRPGIFHLPLVPLMGLGSIYRRSLLRVQGIVGRDGVPLSSVLLAFHTTVRIA